jgi:peptidoglycan/LPS O-acetylase OafA/YrhL
VKPAPARSAAAEHPTSASRTAAAVEAYYPWFDWLRGVLAIAVMLGHDGIVAWSRQANFAVQVFFALSGWLIGTVLLHTRRPDLPRFYFNRAVRIWVPYYIALCLLLGASLLRDPVTSKWLEFVLYKATFVYNLFGTPQLATHVAQMPLQGTGNHFWSVNAEEQFYLLAPLLLVVAAPALGRTRATWLVLSAITWVIGLGTSITFGVTAAVFAFRDETLFRRPIARAVLAVALIASALGLATDRFYDQLAPIASICIVLLLSQPGPRARLGAVAGGMSYPLYLNHWIGVYVAHAALRPFGLRDSLLSHVVSVVLNIGLAVGLYLYVERPLLDRRRQWYTPAFGRRAMVAAYSMIAAGLAFGVVFRLASP